MTEFLPYIAGGVLLLVAAAATWFRWPQIVKMLIAWGGEVLLAYFKADRMDPETEAAWRDCQKRGGRWDARRKRCVDTR